MAQSFEHQGGPGLIKEFLCADSQTFAKGDLVYLDGSGLLTIATNATDYILGMAIEDISDSGTDGDTYCRVLVAQAEDVFLGTLSTDFTVAALAARGSSGYDLSGATEAQKVNAGATSKDIFNVVGPYCRIDETGDYDTNVLVMIRARQWDQ